MSKNQINEETVTSPAKTTSQLPLEKVDEVENSKELVIIFQATKPLDESEHKQLSEKIRFEEEKSGVKIILMPYSCELSKDGS